MTTDGGSAGLQEQGAPHQHHHLPHVPLPAHLEKGLKPGALGLISSIVVGVASTAPAYSLAATLGFVIAAIGLQAPIVTIIAFIPMLFIAYAYKELNNKDPDCGTTFTWGARAFGPKTGWMGGWGIVAADVLVMASLAQIAGQYVFLLFNANGIGSEREQRVGPARGDRVDRRHDAHLLRRHRGVGELPEGPARDRAHDAHAPLGLGAREGRRTARRPSGTSRSPGRWFNPFKISSPSAFINGVLLMLFIYWGWDTTVSVNEETASPHTVPGRAAVLSTLVLLATYVLVVLSTQTYAGIGSTGIGLGNPNNQGDVLSVLGHSVFGTSTLGNILAHLLLLMVLSSAAASTQTTILPTARTVLAMGVYKAVPKRFARTHKRFLTPDLGDRAHGPRVDRALRRDELHLGGHGDLGLRVRPRRDDRVLLRAHRLRVRVVLPSDT